MEFKRWPAFLALTFTVSFRAFALAQELNSQPDVPRTDSQPVIGTIVVEGEEQSAEKPKTEQPPEPGAVQGYILSDEMGALIRLHGLDTASSFIRMKPLDAENLPKFVIGVSLTEVPDSLRAHIQLADGACIMVGAVVPESPAAQAGFQQYDILLKAGDQDLKHSKELQELVDASEGKPLSITLHRQGEEKTLEVTPIKREELKNVPDMVDHQTLLNRMLLDLPNGQASSPLNFTFPSAQLPMGHPVPVDALTDSIRALTEQIERLKGSIDKLEQNQTGDGGRDAERKENNRAKDDGDCWKLPRRDRLTTLISIS